MDEKSLQIISIRELLSTAKNAIDTAIEQKNIYKEKFGEEITFPCLVGVTSCTLEELSRTLEYFIGILDRIINKEENNNTN